MRILLLGQGGREHAISRKLLTEDREHDLVVAPGNPGMLLGTSEGGPSRIRCIAIDPNDPGAVCRLVRELSTELVVVGPEAPLVNGVSDAVREAGVPVFGPSRVAAQIEGSKAFAKRIMRDAGVPTGEAVCANSAAEVVDAVNRFGPPFVVKADGLASGKGVIVTESRVAALEHARLHLRSGPVLVEEYLSGPEVSLFAVTDGECVLPLMPAQDFKRSGDGDTGSNTGGMGAYSPLPWLEASHGGESAFAREVVEQIAAPVVHQLGKAGMPFVGLLYAGLVLTARGIRVIEFNARFGDPETQVVLPRMRTPLSEVLFAAATGVLSRFGAIEFSPDAAVAVVLAAPGYPESPRLGGVLGGLAEATAVPGAHVDFAGVADAPSSATGRGGALVASGGRVLSAVGTGATIPAARDAAYRAVSKVQLEGGHFRSDIAAGVE